MRQFRGLIFFGNVMCEQECELLQSRLQEGMHLLGGLQQPPHSSSAEEAASAKANDSKSREDLYDVIRDLAAALVGREISFGEELMYPPNPGNGVIER